MLIPKQLTTQQNAVHHSRMSASAVAAEVKPLTALIQLIRSAESLVETSRVLFLRWDLSPSQFNALNVLERSASGLSQTELSAELVTHRSNVTGLVDRLEKRGLVERRLDSGDRRVNRLFVSREGRRLIREIRPQFERLADGVWVGTRLADPAVLTQWLVEIEHSSLARRHEISRD